MMPIPPLSFSSGPSMAYGAPVQGHSGAAPVNVNTTYKKYDWELALLVAGLGAVFWYLNRK